MVRSALLTGMLAVGLALACYAPALGPGRQLAGGELFADFYPLGKRVADSLRAGQLLPPARDTTRALGVALAADPDAWSFYPPRLLHAAFDYDLGFKLVFVLHAALAGMGALWLARALGARGRARLLAVVGATLAGPVLSFHRLPPLLAAAAWAPWASAAFIEALATRGRGRWARLALTSGFVALMLLAGGFEVVIGLALVLAVAAPAAISLEGVASAWERRVLEARAPLHLVVVIALGVGLAGMQVVPAAIWLAATTRASHLAHEAAPLSGRLRSLYLGPTIVGGAFAALFGSRRAAALGLACTIALAAAFAGGLTLTVRGCTLELASVVAPETLMLLIAVLTPALAARGVELLRRRTRRGTAALLVLLLVTTLDLLAGRRLILTTVPTSWLHEPPATVALVGDGRVLAQAGMAGLTRHFGDPTPHHDVSLNPVLGQCAHERETLAGGLAGLWGKESASPDLPLAPARLAELLTRDDWNGRAWDLVAASAVLALPGTSYAEKCLFPPDTAPGTCVACRKPETIARAWLCTNVYPWAREDGPMNLAAATPWGSRWRGPIAVVEGGALGFLYEERDEGDAVEVLERTPEAVRVRTRARSRRLLVLSELFLPGTQATVDGREAPAVPADLALVGVPLPAGEHEVAVEFHVAGLPLGVLLSIVSALIAAWLLHRGRARLLGPVPDARSEEPPLSLGYVLRRDREARAGPRGRVRPDVLTEHLRLADALPPELFEDPRVPGEKEA